MSSKVADELMSKIRKMTLALHTSEGELANLETRVEGLRDTQVTVE